MNVKPGEARRREQMRIGQTFLAHFPSRQSARVVAGELGMSRSLVERIEKIAAYKIVTRMRARVNWEALS